MRSSLSASRVRLLSHVALVTTLAGLTAACNSARFNGPLFTGSTENQRQIIGQTNYAEDPSAPPVYAPATYAAAEPISSAPLPAPGGSNAITYGDDGMVASSGNYAWTAVGGQVVTVKAGETLDNLAAKYGVPQQQILAANQLRSASDVRSGRVIVIPRRVAVAADAMPRGTEYADNPPTRPSTPTRKRLRSRRRLRSLAGEDRLDRQRDLRRAAGRHALRHRAQVRHERQRACVARTAFPPTRACRPARR